MLYQGRGPGEGDFLAPKSHHMKTEATTLGPKGLAAFCLCHTQLHKARVSLLFQHTQTYAASPSFAAHPPIHTHQGWASTWPSEVWSPLDRGSRGAIMSHCF